MTPYRACRTCGKYVPYPELLQRAYCSEDCMRMFASCPNCGRYFTRGKGFDGERCSKDCAVHYQILRRYGPQPVTVVTEV